MSGGDVVSSYVGPREVVSGIGACSQIGASLRRSGAGDGTVWVVADKAVAELGLVQPVIDGLGAAGYRAELYSGVAREPTTAIAAEALGGARRCQATAVIGVGGGSGMDVAKVAAAFAASDASIDDVVAGRAAADRPLPLVLVPTTAGTGAEVTNVAMIEHEGHKRALRNQSFVPAAAVLDPNLLESLPQSVIAAAGLDAVSHALEAYVSLNATALTDAAARSALELLAEALPAAYESHAGSDATFATLLGAHLAGWSLNAGVVVGHSIAYTIAARAHLPHGITTGMSLPYALAYALPQATSRLDTFAESLPVSEVRDTQGLLFWLRDLAVSLGAPAGLEAAGLSKADIASMVDEVIHDYPRPNNPVPLETERLSRLLSHLSTGDLAGAIAAMSSPGTGESSGIGKELPA